MDDESAEPYQGDAPEMTVEPETAIAPAPSYPQPPGPASEPATVEMVLAFMAGNFATAFIQALGQRAGSSAANLPRKAGDLVRKYVRRKGEDEVHISAQDISTTTVVITPSTPDEARLALLDVDVTAPELHGKELRWDEATGMWRPS